MSRLRGKSNEFRYVLCRNKGVLKPFTFLGWMKIENTWPTDQKTSAKAIHIGHVSTNRPSIEYFFFSSFFSTSQNQIHIQHVLWVYVYGMDTMPKMECQYHMHIGYWYNTQNGASTFLFNAMLQKMIESMELWNNEQLCISIIEVL